MSLIPFIPVIGKVIDRLFPDKAAADEAKYKLIELQKKGELAFLDADVKLALGQMAINQEEAKHCNWFVSGWRPAVGWICASGLAYQFLVQPLAAWVSAIYLLPVPPVVDTTTLLTMLGGMLGLGVYRSYEKTKGIARS